MKYESGIKIRPLPTLPRPGEGDHGPGEVVCVYGIIIKDAILIYKFMRMIPMDTNSTPIFSPSQGEGGDEEGVRLKVYEKAVKLLSIRLHTTGELYQKLKQRGFKDKDIQSVLRRLEELGFLDDRRFAEIFVDNLKRYKDFGYYGIKAKLLHRKIPSEMAEEALAEFFTLEDEFAVASRYLGKQSARGGSTSGGKKREELAWEKLARSLQSRGFRSEIIRKTLSHLS